MIERIKKLFQAKFDPSRYDSLIAKGTTVVGTVQFSGVLLVAGRVVGKFQPQGEGPFGIIIEKDAQVVLDDALRADYVIVRGSISSSQEGEVKNITALKLLHLQSTASINSAEINVHGSLVVEKGARLSGTVTDHSNDLK